MIKDKKIVRTVQSTPQDYERGLKQVLPQGFTKLHDRIYLKHEAVEIEITYEIIDDFSIGLVRLPMMVVTWTFLGGDLTDQEKLLEKIDFSMQRGLG